MKYRLQYNAKKEFDGHFDCKTPDKEFTHEVKGSVQEKILWLKEIHLRKVKLSLKKEKKLLSNSNKVLGATDHMLRDLTRHMPYEEGVVFDEGNITFKVNVVASMVDPKAAKIPEKKASFFDKSLGVVTFGKLGAKEKEDVEKEVAKKELIDRDPILVNKVKEVEDINKVEDFDKN